MYVCMCVYMCIDWKKRSKHSKASWTTSLLTRFQKKTCCSTLYCNKYSSCSMSWPRFSLSTHTLACALFVCHQPTPPRPPPVLSFVLYLFMRTLLSLSPSPLPLFPASLILVLAFSQVLRALHGFATTLSLTSRLLLAVFVSLALSLCSLRPSVTRSVSLSCSCYRARTLPFLAHVYRDSFLILCISIPSLA